MEVIERGGTTGSPIILLHGYGADHRDLAPLCELYPEGRWLFPNAPLPVMSGRAWFEVNFDKLMQGGDDLDEAFPSGITNAVDQLIGWIEELDLPLKDLTIGGFSQGAVLALEVALKLPSTPKALLFLSGTMIHRETWKQQLPARAEMRFFASHGRSDPLLPFNKSQEVVELFKESGLHGESIPFDGGHEIPSNVLSALAQFLR